MSEPLFPIDAPAADPTEGMSAGRRLTWRQSHQLRLGFHPLSITCGIIKLHTDAAPWDDRKADGLRCGSCTLRISHGAHSYPKCDLGDGIRISHGQATDCRAWWPACASYEAAA